MDIILSVTSDLGSIQIWFLALFSTGRVTGDDYFSLPLQLCKVGWEAAKREAGSSTVYLAEIFDRSAACLTAGSTH